jgi:valyl-tRNA synthetase
LIEWLLVELEKTYNPESTEAPWYAQWEQKAYFKPSANGNDVYSIVIPPPNITGSLHMGHALNSTLQDVLIRWHRMRGDRTVWVPGTDHGGIATQNVVEKLLRSEKKTRFDLGREKFLERMWQWRRESGDTILMQLKRLGASCDWTRTRFTMDDQCSRAVRHAFVALFKKGLIYRGPRMVNWCPRCMTALADIEVEHEDRAGSLWHIRYPLASGNGHIIVATTRPETMLGDTAVAVNPDDERYKAYIGKSIKLPLTNREIPIIADEAVESAFGTGAVKVTPAHDPTDFEIGVRHKLPHEVVIGFDGKMTAKAGQYAGLDRFEARKRIVADLEAQGLLEKTESYRLSAAVCYRCGTIIEPLVSEQWFMKMKDLADRAAQATREGRVKIFPNSWEKPYTTWLDNIRDWCISRQIWWGHRIPVYYCGSKCPPIAAEEPPQKCPQCGSDSLKQDEDVLDTWFSSALWPISVFGWPDQTEDLKTFYPTSVLVTGHEILYLWVARMVMMGLEFQNEVPFKHVYIHGIVRDKQGKKMSKSLGNVIDPLEKMAQFGTDALRFSMAESSIPGRDLHMADDSFMKARNFANKLWNASRFVRMNLEGFSPSPIPASSDLGLADRWILQELQSTIDRVSDSLSTYNPADASRALYEFIWNALCDWYLEISKVALTGSDAKSRTTKQTLLVHLLDQSLALLHPVMPFETEALYQALKPFLSSPVDSIMIHPWPKADPARLDGAAKDKMALVQDVVIAIRTLRSEAVIPPGMMITCALRNLDAHALTILKDPDVLAFICSLARVNNLDLGTGNRPTQFLFTVFGGGEIYIAAEGLVDMEKEKARLLKNKGQLEQMLSRGKIALENPDFLKRAPQEEVENRKQTLVQIEKKLQSLQRNLEGLS